MPRRAGWFRLDNGETTWPDPTDPNEVEWRLRHGHATRADTMVAASGLAAYRELVMATQARRNDVIRQIRAALSRAQEESMADRQPTNEALDALGDAIERHPPGVGRGCNLCAAAQHRADQAEALNGELVAALRGLLAAFRTACKQVIAELRGFYIEDVDVLATAAEAAKAALARCNEGQERKGDDEATCRMGQ